MSLAERTSITLTRQEYALLGGIMGATSVLGVPDPFPGLLAEEIRERLTVIRGELQTRGLIHIRRDNRIVIEPHLAALISPCAFPEVTFLLTLNRPDRAPAQFYFFATGQGVVEMRAADAQPASVELAQLAGADAIHPRCCELLELQQLPELDLPAGEIAQATVVRAREAAIHSGTAAAVQVLVEGGLQKEVAEVLAETLARPVLNASLVSLCQTGQGWKSSGFGLLTGEKGAWRLDATLRDGARLVRFTPRSVDEFQEETARLIAQVLPEQTTGWAGK